MRRHLNKQISNMISFYKISTFIFIVLMLYAHQAFAQKSSKLKPNVVFIYADDLGYEDISCYGATKITTSHIDKLAAKGIRFTNAHSSSATCTPSRYSLMTGQFACLKDDTNVPP